MKNMKFLLFPFLSSVAIATQQGNQVMVYPANAGEATRTVQKMPKEVPHNASQTNNDASKNIFLEYYAKQGSDFAMSAFYNKSGNLVKQDISYDDLQKAVVIFFGDWCPHCHKFLTAFSQHVSKLTLKGIKVILLNVPSVEKLKNWQEPTMQDYQKAIQELNSCGVNLGNNVEMVLLGDRVALSKIGVSGLPVFLAIKNAKEYFRGVGSNGVSKLKLSDPNVLQQFLNIWDEKKDEPKKEKKVATNKKIKKSSDKKIKISKTAKKSSIKLSKRASIESKTATEMLNSIPWKVDLNSKR